VASGVTFVSISPASIAAFICLTDQPSQRRGVMMLTCGR
jgi:hypothetical protein